MINNILAILRGHPLVICGVALVLYALFNRYGRGLSRFNGPFLASLTSLWGMWHVWTPADRPPYVHLHKMYGHIVRLSPNKLSFAQPAAIRDIYGPNGLTEKPDCIWSPSKLQEESYFQHCFPLRIRSGMIACGGV